MNRHVLIRSVSTAVVAVFFATNCAFGYKPEADMWASRRTALDSKRADSRLAFLPTESSAALLPVQNPLSSVTVSDSRIDTLVPQRLRSRLTPLVESLPSSFGSIRGISAVNGVDSGKTIIHIQDVHMNAEAQKNIGLAIARLFNDRRVDLVALEGAFSTFDLTSFRQFPRPSIVRNVADCLRTENKISGAIHAAFTSGQEIPPVIGVDDSVHYAANVEAYRESAPLKASSQEKISKWKRDLADRTSKVFNPELAAFDSQVQAYRGGTLSLGDFVRVLQKRGGRSSVEMKSFEEALELESALDFSKVERERTALLSHLLPRLDERETAAIVQASVDYRMGNVGNRDFYGYLSNLCRIKAISLAQFPSLNSYLHYVLVIDGIDAEKIIAEVLRRENEVYSTLAATSVEKRLVAESRELYLAGKLLEFTLTRSEWNEYSQAVQKPAGLASFEKFYREAEARDAAMAQNLLRAIDQTKANVVVLVTGGFHSDGINHRMSEAGVTTITYVPKVTKVDSAEGSTYLNVFAQEKAPLEKLFEGEKLFLANSPLNWVLAVGGVCGQDALENGVESAAQSVVARKFHVSGITLSPNTPTATVEMEADGMRSRVQVSDAKDRRPSRILELVATPGAWTLWLAMENGIRWMFRLVGVNHRHLNGLSASQAAVRFPIYALAEALLSISLWGQVGMSAAIWGTVGIHLVMHLFGLFDWNEELGRYEAVRLWKARGPPLEVIRGMFGWMTGRPYLIAMGIAIPSSLLGLEFLNQGDILRAAFFFALHGLLNIASVRRILLGEKQDVFPEELLPAPSPGRIPIYFTPAGEVVVSESWQGRIFLPNVPKIDGPLDFNLIQIIILDEGRAERVKESSHLEQYKPTDLEQRAASGKFVSPLLISLVGSSGSASRLWGLAIDEYLTRLESIETNVRERAVIALEHLEMKKNVLPATPEELRESLSEGGTLPLLMSDIDKSLTNRQALLDKDTAKSLQNPGWRTVLVTGIPVYTAVPRVFFGVLPSEKSGVLINSEEDRYFWTAEQRKHKVIYVNEGTERYFFNSQGKLRKDSSYHKGFDSAEQKAEMSRILERKTAEFISTEAGADQELARLLKPEFIDRETIISVKFAGLVKHPRSKELRKKLEALLNAELTGSGFKASASGSTTVSIAKTGIDKGGQVAHELDLMVQYQHLDLHTVASRAVYFGDEFPGNDEATLRTPDLLVVSFGDKPFVDENKGKVNATFVHGGAFRHFAGKVHLKRLKWFLDQNIGDAAKAWDAWRKELQDRWEAGDYSHVSAWPFAGTIVDKNDLFKWQWEAAEMEKHVYGTPTPGAINDSFNRWLISKGFGLGIIGFFEGSLRWMSASTYVAFAGAIVGVFKLPALSVFMAMAPPVVGWLPIALLIAGTVVFAVYSVRYFYGRHFNLGVLVPAGDGSVRPVAGDVQLAMDATRTAASGMIASIPLIMGGFVLISHSSDPFTLAVGAGLIALGILAGGLVHGIANAQSVSQGEQANLVREIGRMEAQVRPQVSAGSRLSDALPFILRQLNAKKPESEDIGRTLDGSGFALESVNRFVLWAHLARYIQTNDTAADLTLEQNVEEIESTLPETAPLVTVVHVNTAADMADFKVLIGRPRSDKSGDVIAVASDEFSESVSGLIGSHPPSARIGMVPLSILSRNPETDLYSYDDVLNSDRVQGLAAVGVLKANSFRNGRVLVVSREPVPFGASQALAEIIEAIMHFGDRWVRYGLDSVLKAAKQAAQSA